MNHFKNVSVTSEHSRVKHFLENDVNWLKQQLTALDSEIDASAVPQRDDMFHHRVLDVMQSSILACRRFEDECQDASLIRQVQAAFWKETNPWFDRSWFANRARTKPSGFPGDFEMLRMLYKEANPPTPALGLGGYLDLCLMDSPLANAVRSRLKVARQFLVDEIESRKGNLRILDIACGPCREYMDWPVFDNDRQMDIIAMDSDPLALDFVASNVSSKMRGSTLTPVRYNALRTRSASANKRRFGTFDIIYSVGLCDYLPDEHLIGMLEAWRETLNDNGVLYIAFKDSDRYDHTVYQWHLDWFFFQRTLSNMMDLFDASGFDVHAMETTRDETGIIVNFICRKPSDSITRIDSADTALRRYSSNQGVSPLAGGGQ